MLNQIVRKIAALQPEWTSRNTPAMQERGRLIRTDLPEALEEHLPLFSRTLGSHGDKTKIEGSDGKGNKTPAPWVRVFSSELSPSATVGFYMVIHFSTNGDQCFVTLGTAAMRWKNNDFHKLSDEELQKQKNWALSTLRDHNQNYTEYQDAIDIGSDRDTPRAFERATILCKTHDINSLDDESFLKSIIDCLVFLKVIYDRCSELGDLTANEINAIELDSVVNPHRQNRKSRQGYGLSGPERRAVELRAMEITKSFLESEGYEVEDVSSNHSFDYLATKDGTELSVEVKGTTGEGTDEPSIMMTANEVTLHSSADTISALAFVSGISFLERGQDARCHKGKLEFFYPWDINTWERTPTAYKVTKIT